MEINAKEKSSAEKVGREHVLGSSLCMHPVIEVSQPCFIQKRNLKREPPYNLESSEGRM